MKLTKMAGVFALTAAMAMAAVPAFAAPEATNVDVFTETNVTNESTATTKVYAQTVNKFLNATIPTRVAIVVPSQGGAITAPDSTVYVIHNDSPNDIKLKSVNSSSAGSAFSLSTTDTLTAGPNHQLGLKLDAGAWTNIALSGSLATATSAPVIGSNQDLGLQLRGNVMPATGTVLSSANLNAAVMDITYTITVA